MVRLSGSASAAGASFIFRTGVKPPSIANAMVDVAANHPDVLECSVRHAAQGDRRLTYNISLYARPFTRADNMDEIPDRSDEILEWPKVCHRRENRSVTVEALMDQWQVVSSASAIPWPPPMQRVTIPRRIWSRFME